MELQGGCDRGVDVGLADLDRVEATDDDGGTGEKEELSKARGVEGQGAANVFEVQGGARGTREPSGEAEGALSQGGARVSEGRGGVRGLKA